MGSIVWSSCQRRPSSRSTYPQSAAAAFVVGLSRSASHWNASVVDVRSTNEPGVLDIDDPGCRMVLIPQTPDQEIRFELASDEGSGTDLTWILTSPVEMDGAAVGHRRFRLNHLLWAELRYSYGQ